MDICDDLLQKYTAHYEYEQKRIPLTLAKYQKEVDDAERELRAAIAEGDKRLIYGYQDILKQCKN